MKKLNKVLFGVGFSVLFLGATGTSAQLSSIDAKDVSTFETGPSINPVFVDKPQVILFKIHDIKPVVDEEGEVKSCEYTATFYNRTPVNIRQAKIQLGWTDEVSERYSIDNTSFDEQNEQENQNKDAEERKEPEAQKQSSAGENLGTFRETLSIPALGSLKQVSVQGQVKTDKCFALFDNIKFNVTSCSILGQDTAIDTRRGRVDADKDQLNCASLFAYVNSKHPEYYSEFKKISYEEQIEHEKTVEEKEKEVIQTIGKNISKNLNDTDSVLDEIK